MRDPRVLNISMFGNPVLRTTAARLGKNEIASDDIQQLIVDLKYTVEKKQYGVGLAAPQVGRSVAVARIAIKPTPTRPHNTLFDRVIINPEIVQTHGRRTRMWEGCISFGKGKDTPYAQTLRWKSITVRYIDEQSKEHTEQLDGLAAHVFQHELDHLNGVLFVDRVSDPKTYMMASEFRKRIVPTLKQ